MIQRKNVLILAASVTTGYTVGSAIEAVKYYGGMVAGIASIFSIPDDIMGYPICSVFDPKDLKDYASYPAHECPMCKRGERLDALVNGFGYSKL